MKTKEDILLDNVEELMKLVKRPTMEQETLYKSIAVTKLDPYERIYVREYESNVKFFNTLDDTYNVMLKLETENITDTTISKTEMNTIKKLFIRRLIAKWNSKYSSEPTSVIIEIDLENRDINTYIRTNESKNDVLKFDYI